MNLKDEMKKRGATPSMLNSKTTDIMLDIIAENNGEIPEGSTGRANDIIENLKQAQKTADSCITRASNVVFDLKHSSKIGKDILEDLKGQLKELSAYIVKDEVDQEALNVFKMCLSIVNDQFKGNMSEAIICKAIEAGSYMAWRSIMGPKYDGYKGKVF